MSRRQSSVRHESGGRRSKTEVTDEQWALVLGTPPSRRVTAQSDVVLASLLSLKRGSEHGSPVNRDAPDVDEWGIPLDYEDDEEDSLRWVRRDRPLTEEERSAPVRTRLVSVGWKETGALPVLGEVEERVAPGLTQGDLWASRGRQLEETEEAWRKRIASLDLPLKEPVVNLDEPAKTLPTVPPLQACLDRIRDGLENWDDRLRRDARLNRTKRALERTGSGISTAPFGSLQRSLSSASLESSSRRMRGSFNNLTRVGGEEDSRAETNVSRLSSQSSAPQASPVALPEIAF